VGGHRESQEPPDRYAIIDLRALSGICGFAEGADSRQTHRQWVAEALTWDEGQGPAGALSHFKSKTIVADT